jgi:hypothetical protein
MKARKLLSAIYQSVWKSFIDATSARLASVCASYNPLFLIIRRIKKLSASRADMSRASPLCKT